MNTAQEVNDSMDIAVIGISCAFPRAADKERFWDNLCRSVETVRFYSDEELRAKGVSEKKLQNSAYVKAASVLEDMEMFDAEFFGIHPNEALSMDPQHRLFLEHCWRAFEDAGYDPGQTEGNVGVFAGAAMNTYLTEVLLKNRTFVKAIGQEQIMIGNDKDYLPTRVSYKLDLKGPSINVNTACSTSLVAIHLARNSLLLGECDMALAGGVSLSLLTHNGYTYVKDGILSPDGHCRPFDEQAKGTIWGDGCGVVLLKRLSDARKDRDSVYAVIKGSAVNNDGSNKVGFTAPSVDEQSHVIIDAIAASGLEFEDIHFVETHGTGTSLGDLVELTALKQAFRSGGSRARACPIGSVKANIGHANTAAGIAGFLKAVLALKHRKLPPSLNYERPNPKFDFADSPFYVNDRLLSLDDVAGPLRAGISSMGIGGTNCHVVVEEAPVQDNVRRLDVRSEQTLILSARSRDALEKMTDNLAEYFERNPDVRLEDAAFTLQCGRRAFAYRRGLRCSSTAEAADLLKRRDSTLLDNDRFQLARDPRLASWLQGQSVDWHEQWQGTEAKRIALPTYPFDRQRFWIEPEATANQETAPGPNPDSYYTKLPDMADWFYVPSWRQTRLPLAAKPRTPVGRLLFADSSTLCERLARKWKQRGEPVVTVTQGSDFVRQGDGQYALHPENAEGYRKLFAELRDAGRLPAQIVFAWSLQPDEPAEGTIDIASLLDPQHRTLFGLLRVVQALAELNISVPMQVVALTGNAFEVTGSERLSLSASTVPGLCMVMQQEYSHLKTRTIDIELPEPGTSPFRQLEENLLQELDNESPSRVCAYRGSRRYERSYETLRIDDGAPRWRNVRSEGNYLIYSGLEGVGFTIAEHIARVIGAKVLLLEEEKFPSRDRWESWVAERPDHALTPRIRNAIYLEECGAEFIGNVGTLQETSALIERTEMRHGLIDGVIHAPGATGVRWRTNLKQLHAEGWLQHFKMINYSLIVLDQVFRDKPLDFRIMLNALASILGGYGTASVVSVSDFAKAYTAKLSRNRDPWLLQCWDASQVLWRKVRDHIPTSMYDKMLEPTALTYEEGLQCFERTFAIRDLTEMAISATSLTNRYNRWVQIEDAPAELAPVLHRRPDMQTPYAEPVTQAEVALSPLFSELLGLEKVGVNDDFFELGGHSLLGLQLVSKIREKFRLDIDSYDVYKYPTVASMAGFLQSKAAEIA